MKPIYNSAMLLAAAALSSATLDVQVSCSNGKNVPNLIVYVVDSLGNQVPGVISTDENGMFRIENSETFFSPLYMSFADYQGSACGSYYIWVDLMGIGRVDLNYYPAELPCSCAHNTAQ